MKFAQADFRKIQISALACIVLTSPPPACSLRRTPIAKAARADCTLARYPTQ